MPEFVAASAGETEQTFQQYLATLYMQSSPGVATTGVLYGMPVAQTTTASGGVTIDVGAGVVQGSLSAGAAPVVNPTLKTMDILVANPMGTVARNDIVVFDTAANPPAIRAIIGAPASPATDPTIPATALPLARVRQAASATTITSSQIDDLRTFTYPYGVGSTLAAPFLSLAQTVASTAPTQNVWTVLSWNTVRENVGGFTYAGGVITAPIAGVYAITVQYTYTSASPTVQIGASVASNASPPVPYRRTWGTTMTGANQAVSHTCELRLTAGQQITLPTITAAANHNLEVDSVGGGTFATVRWVRP